VAAVPNRPAAGFGSARSPGVGPAESRYAAPPRPNAARL